MNQRDKKFDYKKQNIGHFLRSLSLTLKMTTDQFQTIKEYILKKGDRQTYCNMYNHNPHLVFGTYHAYLHPSVGQSNINCDPEKSDFNELVIQDWSSDEIYFRIRSNGDDKPLKFDPPNSRDYFDKLYQFVSQNNLANQ